jgi:hypothetical protein
MNDTPPNPATCIDAAARFLIAQSGALERALAIHQRGPDGRCVAYRSTFRWPCTIAYIAHHATHHLAD